MKFPWEDAVEGLIGLGKEFIVDKDKAIEFEYKTRELSMSMEKTLLSTTTTPKVDALVKLMYACQPFFRPLGSFCMTAFGAWCHYKGITLDVALHSIFDGAFPAWGVSRHVAKQKGITDEPPRKKDYVSPFPEDD